MKPTIIAVIISIGLVAAAVIASPNIAVNRDSGTPISAGRQNVVMEEGVQIIEIDAKGGYLPRKSVAQAGIPTVLRFNTVNTFDCSAAVRIPSLDISKTLPQTGSTDIDIGTPEAGPFKGSCGMGMYPFEIEFE
jgi:plastocyanin domain-containing protein